MNRRAEIEAIRAQHKEAMEKVNELERLYTKLTYLKEGCMELHVEKDGYLLKNQASRDCMRLREEDLDSLRKILNEMEIE